MSDKTALPPRFGRWLKRLRAHHDLTQERLAELAYCSVQAVRAFETGKRRPSVQMAEQLADVLQVPADQREEFVRLARTATVEAEEAVVELPPAPATPAPNGAPSPAPPTPSLAARLPTAPTALIGRQEERLVLQSLLAEERRLITIVGPGGIGKTRLALQLAHELMERFADGALFVPLTAVPTADGIPGAMAEALGVPLPGAGQSTAQIATLLDNRSLLIVLDNFEHLLTETQCDEALALIEGMLQHLPGIQLLITSRERLRLQGEHTFELTGLSVPGLGGTPTTQSDAVLLFLACAQRVARDFALTPANEEAIVRICTLLEGIPLAIELAATWVRTLTVDEIAAEVVRNFDLLALAYRNAPTRHHSLRAVFDHSWTLLSATERTMLARLSVFRGGFDRASANAVTGATLPLLAALIDKSLVRTAALAQPVHRYELHELLAQYLRDKLQELGEAETLVRRHAEHYAALAESVSARLYAQDSHTAQRQLEVEQGNINAVLQWCLTDGHDPELGLRVAGALGRYWYLAGRWKEGRNWLQLARAQAVDGGLARARVLVTLGELLYLLAEPSAAEVCLQEGLARWRAAGDPANIAWALFQLGNLETTRGNLAEGEAHFIESLALYRSLKDAWGTLTVLNQLGVVAINRGEYKQSERWLAEALPLARSLGRAGGIAVSLNLLGRALLAEGETARAVALFEEALALLLARQSQAGIAWSNLNLGLAQLQAGDPTQAAEHFRAALRIYRELESKSGFVAVCLGMAAVRAAAGEFVTATRLLAAAERLRVESGQVLTIYEMEQGERTRAQCQAALAPSAWEAAWTSGTHLSLEQAIALAYHGKL
jgi:predicted ATPase/DNA-binding XRE family transcriptional regulator/Tfp pilus assembly protein PilF